MAKQTKIITREIEYEICDTHIDGYAVLFTRWMEELKGFHVTAGPRALLEERVRTMQDPKIGRVPFREGDPDCHWQPIFITPEAYSELRLKGRTPDEEEAYVPKTWGELPDPQSVLVGGTSQSNSFITLDGSYAHTVFSESACWEMWDRGALSALVKSGDYPMYFTRENYFVPGNGDMFSLRATLSQEAYARFKSGHIKYWDRIAYILEAFGLDPDAYRSNLDDDV